MQSRDTKSRQSNTPADKTPGSWQGQALVSWQARALVSWHGRTPGGPRGQGWGQLTAIKWQQEPTPRSHKGPTKRILRWQQVHWQWYGPHPPHCLLQLKWPLTTPLKWFTTNCLLRQFVTSRGVFKRALSRHWINSTFAQTFDVFDPGPLLFPKYGEDTKL